MATSTASSSATARLWAKFDGLPIAISVIVYTLWWPILELAFYFRVRRFIRVRNAQSTPHTEQDTAEVLRFWSIVFEEESAASVRTIINGWFLGAEEAAVCAGNLTELVAWTLAARPLAELKPAERLVVDSIVARAQRIMGDTPFPHGHEPALTCMTHTLEPLSLCWKPLAFYLCVHIMRELTHKALRCLGFVRHSEGALQYWYHPGKPLADGTNQSSIAPLLVVLHGVGGLLPYVPLLLQLRLAQPSWPLLVPLISQGAIYTPPYDPPPPHDSTAMVLQLSTAIRRHTPHGRPRAAFLAHSLGTAVFASLVKAFPNLVGPSLVVDPSQSLARAPIPAHARLGPRRVGARRVGARGCPGHASSADVHHLTCAQSASCSTAAMCSSTSCTANRSLSPTSSSPVTIPRTWAIGFGWRCTMS